MLNNKIGFGGGCHWCTEGVFNSLLGVRFVEQGWIVSSPPHDTLSEAVIVNFDTTIISIKDLIQIHLYTHSCTSNHSFREKYRSAIYYFEQEQKAIIEICINEMQPEFENPIITKALPFRGFKLNTENYLNYLYSRPQGEFCKSSIYPKLNVLMSRFSKHLNKQKLIDNNINLADNY